MSKSFTMIEITIPILECNWPEKIKKKKIYCLTLLSSFFFLKQKNWKTAMLFWSEFCSNYQRIWHSSNFSDRCNIKISVCSLWLHTFLARKADEHRVIHTNDHFRATIICQESKVGLEYRYLCTAIQGRIEY